MNNPLKAKRISLKLSRKQIAERIGIKERNIRAYEINETLPNVRDLLYVCTKGYEMTKDEIMDYLEYLDKIRKE